MTLVLVQVYLPPLPSTTYLNGKFGTFSLEGLIRGCLVLDPSQRLTAAYLAERLYIMKRKYKW